MGTLTPNMSIYKPAPGEQVYSQPFQAGLDHIDGHDHSGGPYNGKQIDTDGIKDGAITPAKLSSEIIAEATVQTTNGTPTQIVSIPVPESSAITISGKIVALRNDATEAVGGTFWGTFHRPTSNDIQVVGVPFISIVENSSGVPSMELIADIGTQSISVRVIGESAKTFDWHISYNILAQPET